MAKYLLKQSGSEDVLNIFEWDGETSLTPPSGYIFEPFVTESTDFINYIIATESLNATNRLGGYLTGIFEGAITGSVTINGKSIPNLLNETKYGSLKLNVNVTFSALSESLFSENKADFKPITYADILDLSISGSKILVYSTSSILLSAPISGSNLEYNFNYSQSLSKILTENIKNYVIKLKNEIDDNYEIQYLVSNTELTSSTSGSSVTNYYKLDVTDGYNNAYQIKSGSVYGFRNIFNSKWYVDFDLGDKVVAGKIYLENQSLKDVLSDVKNKVKITYFTSSAQIQIPSWTKVVKLIAIGGGGAGGGGVAALTSHSISVGGAGGAGGGFGVAYYDKFKTGSNYYVTCLMGSTAIGGTAYTGSATGSISGFFRNSTTNDNNLQGIDTDVIDYTTIITASRGGDGFPTSLYLENIVSGSSSYLDSSTEYIQAQAEGGAGGWGGYAYRLKITSQSQYNNFYSDINLPLSIPGATITNTKNYGGGKYFGGPGGHGVSLPISTNGYDQNANCAPDLPWGSKSEKRGSTQPKQYPSGILRFPWGRKSEPLYQVNYDKPNNIAPTGGGGGTGWITSSITIQTGSVVTGSGGNLNTSEPILTGYEEYVLKCIGGSGGNLSIYNSLSGNEMPTTGSGPGVGGGGGASSSPNGTPQSGANGSKGLGIVICIGDNLDVPIDQK